MLYPVGMKIFLASTIRPVRLKDYAAAPVVNPAKCVPDLPLPAKPFAANIPKKAVIS